MPAPFRLPATLLVAVAALAALASAPAPAFADPDAQHVSLGLNLGFVSPVGEVGGTVGYHPFEPFALEAGAGIGALGTQLSVMGKAFLGNGPLRLLVAAGPALLLSRDDGQDLWMYTEVGVEGRTGDSLFLALAGGVAFQEGFASPSLRLTTGVRF